MNHRQLSEGEWKFLEESLEIPFPLPLLSPHIQCATDFKLGQSSPKMIESATKAPEEEKDVKKVPIGGLCVVKTPMEEVATKKEVISIPPKALVLPTAGRTNIARVKALTDSMAAIYTTDARRVGYSKLSPTRTTLANAREIEYCRHWVKTGECAHTAKGCWFKHAMPSKEKLKEMGFLGMPRWFHEQGKGEPKRAMLKAPLKPGSPTGKGKQEVSSSGKGDERHAAEIYGVYTTNTTNELMLMDMDDAVRGIQSESTLVTAECTSTKAPSSIASVDVTDVSRVYLHSPSSATAYSSESESEPVESIVAASASASPTITPASEPNTVNEHVLTPPTSPDPSSPSPAPRVVRKHTRAAVKCVRTPPSQPETSLKKSTKPSAQATTTTGPPATKQSAKLTSSVAYKGPTSRMLDNEAAKLAKVFTKRKINGRKGYRAYVRQPLKGKGNNGAWHKREEGR